MATISLSKGVFAFKKSQGNKKLRTTFSKSDYWRQEEGRNDPHIQELTLKNYHECWSSASQVIEDFLDDNHAKVFKDLLNYIRKNGSVVNEGLPESRVGVSKDIPAACLVTGVNMPDHTTIYDSLTKAIKKGVSPHVARLSTGDCSTIKTIIYKLIHSLVAESGVGISLDSDTEDEAFAKSKSPTKKKIKRTQCTMATLASWYQETEMAPNWEAKRPSKSPSKRMKTHHTPKKHKGESPRKFSQISTSMSPSPMQTKETPPFEDVSARPLVIIIEEVESIPVHVFQDLILIASEYRRRVPFLFVLGVSTTPAYIHRHLSQEASSALAMETFQAQPSSSLLSQVIEKILMNCHLPFRVGGKVFKLLLDIFLFHDLSVKNFISGFKFCMLEHFVRGEASFLCCPSKERKRLLRTLPPGPVSALRNLPSYAKLHESLSAEEKRIMMESDAYFCDRVSTLLDELECWYGSFCCLVKVLHSLVHSLPGAPLGKQVREVQAACLGEAGEAVTQTEEFGTAWQLLAMSAKAEIAPKVEAALCILDECGSTGELKELRDKLSKYSERMANIEREAKPREGDARGARLPIELKPSDRFHLKEKLLGGGKPKTARSAFEELRAEMLSCLEHAFIVCLRPARAKPFHEVFFLESVAGVKYHLLGSLRATITTGLLNPHKYLQCACCKLDDADSLATSLPDLSLCYKLHLECGRLINLYDWLQAFIAVLHSEDGRAKARKQRKGEEEALQARFIQAVSELQLLGFIKPTKRKTDHVQRLTWGGC